MSFVLLPHIYLACCFIYLSSIYLVLPLRYLLCACSMCRDYIDTFGNPCGSHIPSLVCTRTCRGDSHIVGSVCVKQASPVLETSRTGFSTDSGLNFYKCADSPIHPPLGDIKILSVIRNFHIWQNVARRRRDVGSHWNRSHPSLTDFPVAPSRMAKCDEMLT
jgi:hypothetical protein